MVDGKIQGAVTVSEGTLILDKDAHESGTLESEPQSEEVRDNHDHAQVKESGAEETSGLVLADEQSPLVSVAVEGDMHEGSTDIGEESEVETDRTV